MHATSIAIASSNIPASTNDTAVNDTREQEFDAFVRERGRDSAQGKDALPALAIGFARAVFDGVKDPAKDANGDDAATRVFKDFCKAEGKKAFHDRTPQSQKSQISKLRSIQKAASNPKYDFVDVLNRAVTIRQTAIDDGIDVKSPYPAYVDVAREQLKLDDELDDAMIFATVTKTEVAREVTLEGQLKKMHKIAEDIITGEKYPGVIDQSSEMHQIEELVRTKLDAIIKLREQSEALEKALGAGYVLNDDGTLTLPAA